MSTESGSSSKPPARARDPNAILDRLADLADDVRRRWKRLEESAEATLEDRIALGEQLQEAFVMMNGSKTRYGRWVAHLGLPLSQVTAWHHRLLAVHAAEARALFRAMGMNGFDYRRFVQLMERAPEHVDAVCGGTMTVAQAIKKVKLDAEMAARVPKLAEVPATASGDGWKMLEGDCLDRLVTLPEESADLVVFDPPYDGDHDALARVAKALVPVLVPQGVVALLTGQMALPQVLEVLGPHLSYGWTYAVPFSGTHLSVIQSRKVRQAWKPVVAYSKGPWPSGRLGLHDDLLPAVTKVNGRFRWEQNPAIAKGLIARLCPEGGVVLDPMAGTASTGVAALELGRTFIGIEADHDRFIGCVERLRGVEREETLGPARLGASAWMDFLG